MKRILALGIFILASNIISAQIRVNTNNTVRIGDIISNVGTQTVDLQITDDVYFQCLPATSGVKIQSHAIGSTNVPMFRPQWNNTFYMGASDRKLWRVYTENMHYTNSYQLSDSSLKKNIDTLRMGIADIKKLKPVKYDIEAPNDSTPAARKQKIKERGKDNMGFLAQEMKQVFPNLVELNEEDGNYMVNYVGLIPVLVRAMQEQQATIEELQEEIDKLKKVKKP